MKSDSDIFAGSESPVKTSVRRSEARRKQERRNNVFAFNSAEWLAMMQQQYVLWPKQDRRRLDRRAAERRELERRSAARTAVRLDTSRRLQTAPQQLLLEEEKQLILSLFAEDDSI